MCGVTVSASIYRGEEGGRYVLCVCLCVFASMESNLLAQNIGNLFFFMYVYQIEITVYCKCRFVQ